MSPRTTTGSRRVSNMENLKLGMKATSRKVARVASGTVLRDATIRRRNRVLSGVKPLKAEEALKRQKACPAVRISLPTPPASPMRTSLAAQLDANTRNVFTFPTNLPRPVPQLIDPERLRPIDEDLANLPIRYIQESLVILATRMFRVCNSIPVADLTIGTVYADQPLPTHHIVNVPDRTAPMPSHLLAPFSKERPVRGPRRLFPIHPIVYTARCADWTPPQPPYNVPHAASVTLPVVPLEVPHPESFGIVHEFLYTKNSARFFAALVPTPNARTLTEHCPDGTVATLIRNLAETYKKQIIVAHLGITAGVYANMRALGIHDDEMWKILRYAWAVLREVLIRSTGSATVAGVGPIMV